MWVFLNNAFVSAVQFDGDPGRLLVRARRREDLGHVFPGVDVQETRNADYRFRCVVQRDELAAAMARSVDDIDYTNFKRSVSDFERHEAYVAVWSVMLEYQHAVDRRNPAERTIKRRRA